MLYCTATFLNHAIRKRDFIVLLRFSVLGSGSSGNAALMVSDTTSVLIDNGFSLKKLRQRFAEIGARLEDLDAVFVTHEHGDHASGLGVLGRAVDVPFYMTAGTRAHLPPKVGIIPRIELFEAGDRIQIGDLVLTSFSISHDAADPVSYVIDNHEARLGIATDIGHCSQLVRLRLAHCHALILESNYCPEKLRLESRYPVQVQQRIRGRRGHMSNQDMSSLLSGLLHDGLRTVVLYHISENSNTPALALKMAAEVLHGHAAELYVTNQDRPTPFFEVRA
jgi:phosphoribosyl 1,2-cyclic phosphodiesterase